MPLLRHWTFLSLLVTALSLAIWIALLLGANFGLPPAAAMAGLSWLATIGLPTSLGMVTAGTLWGHHESLHGLNGFLVLAAFLALAFQALAFRSLARAAARAKARGRPWTCRRALLPVAAPVTLALAVTGLTHPEPPRPARVIDGHAHLFGDAGWPPVHGQTCGLSAAQKANPMYATLLRLLRLPADGEVNTAYVEELVRQAHEARERLGSFRVVLLAQDCRYDTAGEPDWENSSVYVPNAYLFQVVRNHPDLFIPCPSINPQRRDWRAELDSCLAQGARVLKIHPPTQAVDPSDPRFRDFYRACATNGMAIMIHTGSEHAAPIANPTLGDPRLVRLALEEGCTVIAAHAGTKAFFDPPEEDHYPDLVDLMSQHPSLYADTAVLGSLFRWRCIPGITATPAVLPRMLHASDWPFPANALVFWHRLHPLTLLDLMTERNLFVRDARLKLALGMPPETFHQIATLIPTVNDPDARPPAPQAPPSP